MAIIFDEIKIENLLRDLTAAWHIRHQFSKLWKTDLLKTVIETFLSYLSGSPSDTVLLKSTK